MNIKANEPKRQKTPRPASEKWEGGHLHRTKRGGVTHIIDKWVNGFHFHISTRCSQRRAAIKQLEIFEADPFGYIAARKQAKRQIGKVEITDALILEYRDWMIETKGNSRAWAFAVAGFLADWLEDLDGADIRTVSLTEDMKPALERRKTSRPHRIESIKAFCGWLRKEKGLLTRGNDPTLDLSVPQARPEKLRRRKVVDPERISAVHAWLPEETRDVLHFLTATGWHVSEVRRFAEGGELVRGTDPGVLAVVKTRHKSGRWHPTNLHHREQVEVARRILARGRLPIQETLCEHMRNACDKAGLSKEKGEWFSLGQMRHTVLTYAVEHGASPEQASEFAGHSNSKTTRTFYLDLAKPTVSVKTLRLINGGAKTG